MSSSQENLKLVLVTKEKSGDYYYDVSTPALRNRAFYLLLKERMDQNWYWVLDDPREANPQLEEEIRAMEQLLTDDALPAELRPNAKQNIARKKAQLEEYEESARWWKRAQKVLSLPEQDGITYRLKSGVINEAELLMHEHIDHQYEGFDIIRIQKV